MAFTEHERRYLAEQPLGRIATTSAAGEPDIAPVGFGVDDGGVIEIGGLDNTKTIKWHNVLATGRAAFVVDDLATVDPWRPRGVKVRGAAEAVTTDAGHRVIRITPERVWSWGLNPDAPKHFAGMIERRDVQ
jgi:pyridoxamine 5'-phosphate oxidase family protein